MEERLSPPEEFICIECGNSVTEEDIDGQEEKCLDCMSKFRNDRIWHKPLSDLIQGIEESKAPRFLIDYATLLINASNHEIDEFVKKELEKYDS
jgi:DNA-directed RNA polymerase subunit RPC12/RpoP